MFFWLLMGRLVFMVGSAYTGCSAVCVHTVYYTLLPGVRGLEMLLSVILTVSMHAAANMVARLGSDLDIWQDRRNPAEVLALLQTSLLNQDGVCSFGCRHRYE